MDTEALARECSKLDPQSEQAMADDGLAKDLCEWPNTKRRHLLGRSRLTCGHEQAGQLPVLIVSNEIFNQWSGTVSAMALTSQPHRAGFPLTMNLDDSNIPKKSRVKISQICTLSVER